MPTTTRQRCRRAMMAILLLLGLAVSMGLAGFVVARVTPSAYPTADNPRARFVALAEGRIRIEDRGSGKDAVVLLHGFNGELANWTEVWREPRFERCAPRALRLDLPGFGASEWSTADYGLPSQAKRVMALLDTLRVEHATLVGTSMGGSLAATIAAEYPDRVRHLVLLAPSGFAGSLTYPGLYGAMIRPGWINRAAGWIVRRRTFQRAFPKSRALQALTVTSTYGTPWEDAVRRIRTPTLLAWSRGDAVVDPADAMRVAEAIPGSGLVMLDVSVGHGIPTEAPAFVADVLCRLRAGASPGDIAARFAAERP